MHGSAGEHTHNHLWSFLHGAYASGLRQAEVILQHRRDHPAPRRGPGSDDDDVAPADNQGQGSGSDKGATTPDDDERYAVGSEDDY